MARKVFFSFKYEDVSRAMVVRNSALTKGEEVAGFFPCGVLGDKVMPRPFVYPCVMLPRIGWKFQINARDPEEQGKAEPREDRPDDGGRRTEDIGRLVG